MVASAVPVEVLLGVYLGLLTGIIPAVVSWGLAFIFKYVTGVSIPALAVVVFSLAIAGANGGLLALNDPTIRGAPNSLTLTTAIIVVLMMSLYTHSKGDKLGTALPKHLTLSRLRERSLSTDVIELVGGRGQVHVTVAGSVENLEGYPPIQPELREELREEEWTMPADLPLSELERRIEDSLRTEYGLADVSVQVDVRGRATVAAAPPTIGVSKRVPPGRRAVSVRALVPTGIARGDEVTLALPDASIDGRVVSAQSSVADDEPAPAAGPLHGGDGLSTDGGTDEDDGEPTSPPATPTTDGGDGRITVAVRPHEATRILRADRAKVVVNARGTHREFELLALLNRAGKRFRKLTVGPGADVAGTTIGDAAIRDEHDVAVLAVRRTDGWTLAPGGSTPIHVGDELFVVGTGGRIERFREVVA